RGPGERTGPLRDGLPREPRGAAHRAGPRPGLRRARPEPRRARPDARAGAVDRLRGAATRRGRRGAALGRPGRAGGSTMMRALYVWAALRLAACAAPTVSGPGPQHQAPPPEAAPSWVETGHHPELPAGSVEAVAVDASLEAAYASAREGLTR